MNKKLENGSAETRCPEANLNPENGVSLSPMLLVDEQDIINTYSEEEKFSCQKYAEYQKLIKENPLLVISAVQSSWESRKEEQDGGTQKEQRKQFLCR